ncbi:hypothetical protein [Escherichia coli]|nr:hypothetical protein [Escherichia coli]
MIEEIILAHLDRCCAIPDTSSSHCRRYDPAASFPALSQIFRNSRAHCAT